MVVQSTQKKSYSLCVIGAGYVGLVAAGCFAKLGHTVICVDSDERKIKLLKEKKIPNYEPGLEPIIKTAVQKKLLRFTSHIAEGVREAEIIFLAVGTPPLANGEADLSALENVAQQIAKNLTAYKLIVEKSTVPAKTGLKIKETIRRYAPPGSKFDIASNPEFLREGRAVYDFLHPDRIVIGVETEKAEKILRNLYRLMEAPLIVTDINTAELIKHASNSFLATKISFINAVSRICEYTRADIKQVALGMGLDERIGRKFLDAGIGFGGSCFPKDVDAFLHLAQEVGYDFKLLEEVKNINHAQRVHFVSKIKEVLWILKGKKIGVLGLSFKPHTDDIRDSPALEIIELLKKEGAKIAAYDPQAMEKAKTVVDGVEFFTSPEEVLAGADCLALLTDWDEFRKLNFKAIKKTMRFPFVADGRNFYDRHTLETLGFTYIALGG